jgi:chitin synthase
MLYSALSALTPFLTCTTPQNSSSAQYSALAATFTLSLAGNLTAASLALSTSGINTLAGLLHVPAEAGYRAFDVFYYLLTSASTPAEREFLGLKSPASYALLNRSGTYEPPSYLPTADDAASADDFRSALKAIGIKGAAQRNLLSILAGLLKLGDTLGFLVDLEIIEEICEDVAGLLGLEPEALIQHCNTAEREILIAGIYEALVDWVIARANEAIASAMQLSREGDSSSDGGERIGTRTPRSDEDNDDTVAITVIEIPSPALAKAAALRGVFDDTAGINAEMKDDGIEVIPAGSSVLKEMGNAVAEVGPDLGIMSGLIGREQEQSKDRRDGVLEKIGREAESDSFLRTILYPDLGEGVNVGNQGRFDLASVLGSSRVWYQLGLHPTDDSPATLATLPSMTSAWSAGTVSRQLRGWRLPEWANRRNRHLDFTADFDIDEFVSRYSRLGCQDGKDGVESWLLERGWSNGEVVIGHERIWMREGAWWEAESMLDIKPTEDISFDRRQSSRDLLDTPGLQSGYSLSGPGANGSGFFTPMGDNPGAYGSRDHLLQRPRSNMSLGAHSVLPTPSCAPAMQPRGPGDYGLGSKGDDKKGQSLWYGKDLGNFGADMDPEVGDSRKIAEVPISKVRRVWVGFVWALTFWIPSTVLRYVGRMKRPDVRMAWREKLVLVLLIFFLNALVVFYIIEFGRLLCPNYDKAWSEQELSYHQGDNDFWVSIHGKVYDISKFWRIQHSDTNVETTTDLMQPFAGMNLDDYFAPPLTVACPGLVTDDSIMLQANNTPEYPVGLHTSGPQYQPDTQTALHDITWYAQKFEPFIEQFYKGDLVTKKKVIASQGQNENHQWVILFGKVFDLTNYFYTAQLENGLSAYHFLDPKAETIIKQNPGTDITQLWQDQLNYTAGINNFNCLTNAFYVGKPDFRDTPKCQVNNYILLSFTIVLCAVILIKFLAALQLGSKRRPAAQDKFVICQVPAYTEGEDQLRKGLDSLTALQYDNKRKLICVICDGMIVGGGNDRPTPKIVLDILGVDPKIDPPVLPFKSVGQSNDQLNYGKVYSGLYEYEGNVVPYVVVVKVGKESEQAKPKPGNRGKRDSQFLLLSFLNRVHHRSPMSPLELEMFHQINNIIGVDPELYEYVLMVDADTSVREDSLNRLVASCANDAKIAGICGETSLENEERSWWTMIQVYEYYISHHLAKAFESLFGSVTCLPGW